jgi:hypothetical protein
MLTMLGTSSEVERLAFKVSSQHPHSQVHRGCWPENMEQYEIEFISANIP